jgi:hypothetical protein
VVRSASTTNLFRATLTSLPARNPRTREGCKNQSKEDARRTTASLAKARLRLRMLPQDALSPKAAFRAPPQHSAAPSSKTSRRTRNAYVMAAPMVTRRGKSTPIVRSYRAEPCRPTKIEVSTGGGEVAHYIARHGESRISKPSRIAKRNGALLWITLPHMGSYMVTLRKNEDGEGRQVWGSGTGPRPSPFLGAYQRNLDTVGTVFSFCSRESRAEKR